MRIVELSDISSVVIYILTIAMSAYCMNHAIKAKKKRTTKIWLALTIIIVSIPGFFRYMVGIDYETYYYVGERIRKANSIEFALTFWGRLESSFGLLIYGLGKIGLATEVAIGLYAVLTQIFMVLGIWNFRKDINPTVALLIYLSSFYFRTYNMFRQALSMAIILFAIHYLREKKIWDFIIFVVIATFIHRPAIISILMIWYFRPLKKKTKWLDVFLGYVLPACIAIGFEYLIRLARYIPILSIYITSTDKYTTLRRESLWSLGTLLLIIEITLYIWHRREYKHIENQYIFESVLDRTMFFEIIYFVLDVVAGFAARIVLFYSVGSIIALSSLYNTKASLLNKKQEKNKTTVYRLFLLAYCIAQFVRIMLNNGYGQLPYSFWYY